MRRKSSIGYRHRKWLIVLALAGCASAAESAVAEVILDGSMGPAGQLPAHAVISKDMGQIRDRNLFHSFHRFSLKAGESAEFTGPSGLKNVISRVTGGVRSDIDGLLKSSIPGADFWFINPAGVFFGPNARIDVLAAFRVSTADELRFADGAVFSATNPAASVLTVADPVAFGFLRAQPAPISTNFAPLDGKPGQTLSIVAGPIEVNGGYLWAPQGTVIAASVGGPAEVAANGEITGAGGPLALNGTIVDVSGDGGGTIRIRGGRFVSHMSNILAYNDGLTDGTGGVSIQARSVALKNSIVGTKARNLGRAAGITIEASGGPLDINGSIIDVSGYRPGAVRIEGDTVRFQDANVLATNYGAPDASGEISVWGSSVSAFSSTFGKDLAYRELGLGLDIRITAASGSLDLEDALVNASGAGGGTVALHGNAVNLRGSGIFAENFGSGDSAGQIMIGGGSITIAAGVGPSVVSSSSYDTGKGPDIVLSADNEIAIGGCTEVSSCTRVSSVANGSGPAGDVSVSAPSVLIENGGQVGSGTWGWSPTADAGDVILRAGGITIGRESSVFNGTFGPGDAGNIDIVTGDLTIDAGPRGQVTNRAAIINQTAAGSSGRGGDIIIAADHTTILNGGRITTTIRGSGDGGDIHVASNTIRVDGFGSAPNDSDKMPSSIETGANRGSTGHPGGIQIDSGELYVTNGALLNTSSGGARSAGDITVAARDRISISGELAAIESSTVGQGDGGNIVIDAPKALLGIDHGVIEASSFWVGAPGSVSISVARLSGGEGTVIAAFAYGPVKLPGDTRVGNVEIRASSAIDLAGKPGGDNAAGISTATTGVRDAGRIYISTPDLRLTHSALIDSSTLSDASAGAVQVDVDRLYVGPKSAISASAVLGSPTVRGSAGTVSVTARDRAAVDGGRIQTRTDTAGSAGSIDITTPQLSLSNAGLISSESHGPGRAGRVVISVADTLKLRGGSQITTRSGTAGGGDIDIRVRDLIHLKGGSRIGVDVATGGATAGDIFIDPRFLVLDGSAISATADAGSGGRITILADHLILSPDSEITARAGPAGIDGTVLITAPELDLSGGLQPLPGAIVDPSSLLRESCAARGGESTSTFTRAGRGGLPPGADDLQPAYYGSGGVGGHGTGSAAHWDGSVQRVAACGTREQTVE